MILTSKKNKNFTPMFLNFYVVMSTQFIEYHHDLNNNEIQLPSYISDRFELAKLYQNFLKSQDIKLNIQYLQDICQDDEKSYEYFFYLLNIIKPNLYNFEDVINLEISTNLTFEYKQWFIDIYKHLNIKEISLFELQEFTKEFTNSIVNYKFIRADISKEIGDFLNILRVY